MTARLAVLVRWLLLAALVGAVCGASSAFFLWALARVTTLRIEHRVLVLALPLAGLLVGALYDRYGATVRGGTNQVVAALSAPAAKLPTRMAPMVLLGTLATHLVGGSAGREGTAVQMSGSLASRLGRELGLDATSRRIFLRAGVAAGFGSVFGTPIAGALFALEVAHAERIEVVALLPAIVASLIADRVARALGAMHGTTPTVPDLAFTPGTVLAWLVFAAAVAAVVGAFLAATDAVRRAGERRLPRLAFRMAFGGLAVLGLVTATGAHEHLGLSLPLLERAFVDPSLPKATFALKWLFTVLTIGAGFIGGEVTPLFVIGAALGNALAPTLGLPLPLAATVGLAATFGAAANCPIALAVMAAEMAGIGVLPHVLFVTAVATALLGERALYPARYATNSPK